MTKSFSLKAFGDQTCLRAVYVTIDLQEQLWQLEYRFLGPMDLLQWPDNSGRQNKLWENTCGECFVRPTLEKTSYLEFHFAPKSAWNALAFENIRQGQKDGKDMKVEVKSVLSRQEGIIQVSLHNPPKVAAIGLTAVAALKDRSLEYWAIEHRKEKPDFHDFDAFVTVK